MTEMFTLPQNFNMAELVHRLATIYQAEGYNVLATTFTPANATIKFSKDMGGGKQYVLGLSQEICAHITVTGGTITVNYSGAEVIGKAIAGGVGLLVFLFLVGICIGLFGVVMIITAIIGAVRQSELPRKINMSIIGILSEFQNQVQQG